MARRPTPEGQPELTAFEHFADLIKTTIPPLHPAGVPFVAGSLGLAALGHRHGWIRRVGLVGALVSGAFFRHPHRVPPVERGVVVAPADGTIALVDAAVPPVELNLGEVALPRVSTFLSIFDVHVQRVPVGGRVRSVVHRPGKFLSADKAAASAENERTSMLIRTDSGAEVAVVQIAGLIARRIVCDAKPGDQLDLGSTYGVIRFGSRVDVYFPAGTELLVQVGQRAIGAETVFAKLP